MVYYTIFRHALVDPNLAVRFPKSDLDIIRDLPSHNDAKFTNHARDSLAEACSKIENINGNDLRSAQSMAAHFEAAKSQIRNQLNEHYEAVLLELSDRGRDVVKSEVIRLSYNNAISSTDFDLNPRKIYLEPGQSSFWVPVIYRHVPPVCTMVARRSASMFSCLSAVVHGT